MTDGVLLREPVVVHCTLKKVCFYNKFSVHTVFMQNTAVDVPEDRHPTQLETSASIYILYISIIIKF